MVFNFLDDPDIGIPTVLLRSFLVGLPSLYLLRGSKEGILRLEMLIWSYDICYNSVGAAGFYLEVIVMSLISDWDAFCCDFLARPNFFKPLELSLPLIYFLIALFLEAEPCDCLGTPLPFA